MAAGRSNRRGWLLSASIVVAVLAACTKGDGKDAAPTGASTGGSAGTRPCEVIGYPCDWRDADKAVLDRSLELLDETADRLKAGESPEALADYLAGLPEVAATNWAPEGVLFRLEGGLPVTALSEAAAPLVADIPIRAPSLVSRAGENESESSRTARAPRAVLATYGASDSTYEPPREPNTRPRSAMVLSPTRSADLAAAQEANTRIGATPPTAPPTATRDVLVASEHYRVLDLADGEAHPGHWANMAKFDLVVIETHGADYLCKPDRDVCGVHLVGPLAQPYLDARGLSGDEAAFKDFGGVTFARSSIDDEYHIAFSVDFFRRVYGDGVGKTIIIVNACRMGEESVSTRLLSGELAGSRATVFSWTSAVPRVSADEATAKLVSLILDGADASAALKQLPFAIPYPVSYKGILAEIIVTQGPEANRRGRDVVNTLVDGQQAKPGTRISATGTPEDGQNDRIRGVEVRIDGVHPGDEEETKIVITVDGKPLKVIQNGAPVDEVRLGPTTVRQGASDGPWNHHRIDLENAILPFDLTREDVTQGRGHTWKVEVSGAAGGPSVHEVLPVVFRLGTVKVMHPGTADPLVPNGLVQLDGEANDGEAEVYSLVIRVEHLNDDARNEHVVEAEVDGRLLTVGLDKFTRVNDGAYRYEADITLRDFTEQKTPVDIKAKLIRVPRSGEKQVVDEFDGSPTILVVRAEGRGTLNIMGVTFEFVVPRCYVGPRGNLDDAGNPEFSLEGTGMHEGAPFDIEVINRVFSSQPGQTTADSIVIEYQGRDILESRLYYFELVDGIPTEKKLEHRFLEFEDDYRKVSGVGYFWGDFVNTDLATLPYVVAAGELRATCP